MPTLLRRNASRWNLRWIIAGVACLLASGCSKNSEERFIPSPQKAEGALHVVLQGWKDGQDKQQLFDLSTSGQNVQVHITDSHRKAGQRLAEFRILGEVVGRKPRYFTVELKLENPDETQRVRFVVVGIDPIWIFREDDYDMLTHWHHPVESPVGESSQGYVEEQDNSQL